MIRCTISSNKLAGWFTKTYYCFSLKSKIGSLEAENEVLRNRPVAVEHISVPAGALTESKVQISRLHIFPWEYSFHSYKLLMYADFR